MPGKVTVIAAVFIIFLSDPSLAQSPDLKILPEGPQTVRANRNLVLTCRAQVPNSELVKDLKWIDPKGNEVSQDSRMYTEVHVEDVAISLFIKKMSDDYSGDYTC